LELCQIWGHLDPEISSKIKFSKYHAVRIAKALKNGEDPNLSNPVREEEVSTNTHSESLDPSDPEVQALQGSTGPPPLAASLAQQPSVEEVPDESDRILRQLAQQSVLDESLHPSRTPSVPPAAAPPELPSAPSDLTLPQVPPTLPDTPGLTDLGSIHSSAPEGAFQSFPPPASAQLPNTRHYPQAPAPQLAPHVYPTYGASPPLTLPHQLVQAAPVDKPVAGVDDQSITQAQKHARWAVSALNFDDVGTAIKELNTALRYLQSE
jgi:vacuolar protein sorting-associated protein VTA1